MQYVRFFVDKTFVMISDKPIRLSVRKKQAGSYYAGINICSCVVMSEQNSMS